jgi:hypothetical protein
MPSPLTVAAIGTGVAVGGAGVALGGGGVGGVWGVQEVNQETASVTARKAAAKRSPRFGL